MATAAGRGRQPRQLSPGVRPVTLDADGVALSGLLSEPAQGPPRAVIVALHGGGMNAGYFDGQAHPDVSLLTLGARLGYTVLALDRPGYGASAAGLPGGQRLGPQATTVRAAIAAFTAAHAPGTGTLLLGHSFGAKVAFAVAADWDAPALLGVDVSGCGRRLAVTAGRLRPGRGEGLRRLNWGPLSLYPSDTFRMSRTVVAPMPAREFSTVAGWLRLSGAILPRVRVPVRLTFAQHEAWWGREDDDLADLTGQLSAAPRVVVDHLPHAGHNISLGWAARAYHLKALAFAEECLTARAHRTMSPRGTPPPCG
ncbi:alpha/beta fold hydrolase [Streptomyces djakartensis]|uniref:Thioesterase n=1 Tax=Streptomyces djakartensis TaxID=68193 RepID=A0ABQ2ZSZ8_9ACTN|nr:alpha/beta fold hydrolase [Streptomyces djakartensis]GGY24609.1 thioesterase [Streptomyces djakartensis]